VGFGEIVSFCGGVFSERKLSRPSFYCIHHFIRYKEIHLNPFFIWTGAAFVYAGLPTSKELPYFVRNLVAK